MWVFARQGFISAVEDRVAPDRIIMRARVAEDLHAILALHYRTRDVSAMVKTTPVSDYRYRVTVTRRVFESIMLKLARSIDYGNFKGATVDVGDDDDRYSAYHEVWAAMWRFQANREQDAAMAEVDFEGEEAVPARSRKKNRRGR